MLKNIFQKTMYEKRWMMLAWGIGLFALVLLTVVLFPTFRDSFGQSLKDVPESLKNLLGDASAYQTIEGFLDLQVIAQMVFMTIIMGVILCPGLLAGEENDGTLQTLLVQPISRSRVYIQKLLVSIVIIGAVCAAIFLAMFVGALLIRQSLPIWRAFLATVMLWLVTLVFSLLGYSLGAITGRRGISGATAGALAFVFFLITSMASSVPALKAVNHISPFYYFNNPSVLRYGLEFGDMLILIAIIAFLSVLGGIVFMRRDIYQR